MPAVRPLGHPSLWCRDLGAQVNLRKRVFNVEHPHLPRLSAARYRLQRLQRTTGRIDVPLGARGSPPLPGACAPTTLDFVDAVGDWDSGALQVRTLREPVRLTVYRPPIGRLLPVYVADRYEGFDAKRFADCTDEEIEDYVARNVDGGARGRGARPARTSRSPTTSSWARRSWPARSTTCPYAVKIHGSALEYTVKPRPRALRAVGARGPRACARRSSSARATPPRACGRRWTTRQPAGAHPARAARRRRARSSAPRAPEAAQAAAARPRDAASPRCRPRSPPRATASRATTLPPAPRSPGCTRATTGSSRSSASCSSAKGVDLLAAAFPLVLRRRAAGEARRRRLRRVPRRPAASSWRCWPPATWPARGSSRERGGRARPAEPPARFLEELESSDDREAYLAAAARLPERCVLTGRLEHAELADLLPACEAQVVPSTFPEAFGMVAAEAAACGILPVSAGALRPRRGHPGARGGGAGAGAAVAGLRGGRRSRARPRVVAHLLAAGAGGRARGDPRRHSSRSSASGTRGKGVARTVVASARGELSELEPVT